MDNSRLAGIGTPISNNANNRLDVSGNAYIKGQLGVNITPGDRTLDVNGDFRASDAYGTLDFSNGLTSSAEGFASLRGTVTVSGGVTTIGTVKFGMIAISALEVGGTTSYAARLVFCHKSGTFVEVGSNVTAGGVSITLSSLNIQITDAANKTYKWSITYFPL